MTWLRRGLLAAALAALLGLGALAWVGQRVALVLVTPALLAPHLAERPAPPAGDPGEALGLPFETWDVPTPPGPAPAVWIPAPEPSGLAALYVHPLGGRPSDGYRWVPALRAAGLPVLLMRYRNDPGAPPSEEGRYGVGLTEWPDVAAALAALRERGHGRIVLIGASMGGALVGQALARPEAAEGVVGVILDSPALDGPAATAQVIRGLGVPLPGLAAWMGVRIAGWRIGIPLSRARVTEGLAASPLPLLLLHGAGDGITPVAVSDALVARRAAPVLYLRTEGDHLQAWVTDPALVEGAVAGFLAALAAPERGGTPGGGRRPGVP